MQCMYCGSPETRVTDSVKAEAMVLRERVCQSCHKHFYTKETSPAESQFIISTQLKMIRGNNARGNMAGSNAR